MIKLKILFLIAVIFSSLILAGRVSAQSSTAMYTISQTDINGWLTSVSEQGCDTTCQKSPQITRCFSGLLGEKVAFNNDLYSLMNAVASCLSSSVKPYYDNLDKTSCANNQTCLNAYTQCSLTPSQCYTKSIATLKPTTSTQVKTAVPKTPAVPASKTTVPTNTGTVSTNSVSGPLIAAGTIKSIESQIANSCNQNAACISAVKGNCFGGNGIDTGPVDKGSGANAIYSSSLDKGGNGGNATAALSKVINCINSSGGTSKTGGGGGGAVTNNAVRLVVSSLLTIDGTQYQNYPMQSGGTSITLPSPKTYSARVVITYSDKTTNTLVFAINYNPNAKTGGGGGGSSSTPKVPATQISATCTGSTSYSVISCTGRCSSAGCQSGDEEASLKTCSTGAQTSACIPQTQCPSGQNKCTDGNNPAEKNPNTGQTTMCSFTQSCAGGGVQQCSNGEIIDNKCTYIQGTSSCGACPAPAAVQTCDGQAVGSYQTQCISCNTSQSRQCGSNGQWGGWSTNGNDPNTCGYKCAAQPAPGPKAGDPCSGYPQSCTKPDGSQGAQFCSPGIIQSNGVSCGYNGNIAGTSCGACN